MQTNINQFTITINKCGDNSVLGTLMTNEDTSDFIQKYGLNTFSRSLKASSKKICFVCREKDREEVERQIKELDLPYLITIAEPA